MQNSKLFHSRVLWFESKNYSNYKGSNSIEGKKIIGYNIANISNLLLQANIDIDLFAKPFVSSFNVACEIAIWK